MIFKLTPAQREAVVRETAERNYLELRQRTEAIHHGPIRSSQVDSALRAVAEMLAEREYT